MTDDALASTSDTAGITRGARRLLYDLGYDSLTEFQFRTGRRADIMALNQGGEIVVVEVKSSLADFRSDAKWPEYREWCDALFFAVDAVFPAEILPSDHGLMVCDAYGGEVLRDAPRAKLPTARRKMLTLRFGLVAARRLQGLLDERVEGGGQK
ncbi:MAG: MmcB family DNA repair protein [Proteobacteria bacterium]|nr:MmcB family DNA repair protein [Pseudomonadota bacterium]MDA1059700.1 MmcB family DNA repair protein [Pseudomonadota bacterium]